MQLSSLRAYLPYTVLVSGRGIDHSNTELWGGAVAAREDITTNSASTYGTEIHGYVLTQNACGTSNTMNNADIYFEWSQGLFFANSRPMVTLETVLTAA